MRIPRICFLVGLALLSSGCSRFQRSIDPSYSSTQSGAFPQATFDGSSDLVSGSSKSDSDQHPISQSSDGNEAHMNERKPHVVSKQIANAFISDIADNSVGDEIDSNQQASAYITDMADNNNGDEADMDLLNDLEDRLIDLEERVGDRAVIHAMDATKLDLGGFVTQTFTSIQSNARNESSFDLSQIELFLAGEINEKVSIFSILEFKRNARIDISDPSHVKFDPFGNDAELELAWANYKVSDAIQFQVGRFITPHGIINIEHFHPTLLYVPYPMFMRQEQPPAFFSRFTVGTQFHGHKYVGCDEKDRLEYNVYIGSEKRSASDFVYGARVAYTYTDYGLTLGANYGHGIHASLSPSSPFDFFGMDILYDKYNVIWKNEIYSSLERNADNHFGFYTQPGFRFCEKWIAFYRFDYLDPGRGLGNRSEHVAGLNYLPSPLIRLRGAVTFASFPGFNNDFQLLQLSTTVSF